MHNEQIDEEQQLSGRIGDSSRQTTHVLNGGGGLSSLALDEAKGTRREREKIVSSFDQCPLTYLIFRVFEVVVRVDGCRRRCYSDNLRGEEMKMKRENR